jgi:hypothetical protein
MYIYVLKLEEEKYYIGRTENPDFRLEQHFNGNASAWTNKYKPVQILQLYTGDNGDEDKYVIKYMDLYGIDNVRGGTFSQIEFDDETKRLLTKMCYSLGNKCFRCGEKGHYVRQCKQNVISYPKQEEQKNDSFLSGLLNVVTTYVNEWTTKPCKRCGRDSHTEQQCYAKTTVYGNKI